eukprot:TRINITY_DN11787_c0_g1_i2.p1 TRINITY_DN11787_c0_g1~~TRINITY_DN11787_c0_g1_i2.p1  ORF type:complete len:298 (+),score=44.78 TRINITY_DN11787_c0_g1_i2:64-957(+)
MCIRDSYYNGVEFLRYVYRFLDEKGVSRDRVTLTGHSLGAFTAEVIGVNDKRKVVSFESPGTRSILQLHFNYTEEQLANADVTTFLNVYNPINTNGKHIGKVYRIIDGFEGVDLSVFKGVTGNPVNLFVLGTFTFHRLSEVLKSFDAKTGYPRHYEEVKDWPSNQTMGYYCYYLNYTKNMGFWDNVIEFAWNNGEGRLGKRDFSDYRNEYIRMKLMDETKVSCEATFGKLLKENFMNFIGYSRVLMNQVTRLIQMQFKQDQIIYSNSDYVHDLMLLHHALIFILQQPVSGILFSFYI